MREGVEQGIEQERGKRLASARTMLLSYTEVRFPTLKQVAQEQASQIENPDVVEQLALKVIRAQTVQEAERSFLNWRHQ